MWIIRLMLWPLCTLFGVQSEIQLAQYQCTHINIKVAPLFAFVCNSAPDSSPSKLLLPDCVRFSCCSPIASIHFNCCSLFVSASDAARHLCLLPLLLPDCVHFNCSPIASASAVAPRLRPLHLLLRLHLQLVRFDCCLPIFICQLF